jgi:hypothetical protein
MWKRYLLDAVKSFKVHIRPPRLGLVRQAHDPELAEGLVEGFSLGEEREIRERGF